MLVVVRQGRRQRVVNDVPHVGLVNALAAARARTIRIRESNWIDSERNTPAQRSAVQFVTAQSPSPIRKLQWRRVS